MPCRTSFRTYITALPLSLTRDNGTLRLTRSAKVNDGLGDGTLIQATANATVSPEGKTTIKNLQGTPLLGVCQGPYNFQQEVIDGGAWLVDMKFGNETGNGLAFLTPGDRTIKAWTTDTTETDWVKFTPPTGYIIPGETTPATVESFTAYVMSKATYIANDPTPPLYIGGATPNADWFDSLNWKYDPSTFTGEVRLPVGTQIEVQRQVTYANCHDGVYSSIPDSARKFGIATQIAINDLPAQGSDQDVFWMPGQSPLASCETNIFVSTNHINVGSGRTTFWTWTPGSAASSKQTATLRADGVAATDKHSTYIFTLDYISPTLKAVDLSNNNAVTTLQTTGLPAGQYASLAFDHNGNLWVMLGGSTYVLRAKQVSDLLSGASAAWTKGPNLQDTAGSAFTRIADFAFDGAGNAYVLTTAGNISRVDNVAGAVGATTVDTTTLKASKSNTLPDSEFRALAFANDATGNSTLYASTSFTNSPTLYTVDWSGDLAGTQVTRTGFPVGGTTTSPSDFGSCAFPVPAAFKVQKSVVNPDGTVAPPGTVDNARI